MPVEQDKTQSTNTNSDIDFRPVTSGLGFHPFSDGLPYAPVSKTVPRPNPDFQKGSGAVAAGPVSFARTLPRGPGVPHVHVPTARKTTSAAEPLLQPLPSLAPTYGLRYLCKRVLAYAVDTVVNLALLCTGLMIALWNQQVRPEIFMNPSLLALGIFFCLVFNWALITAQEVAFSTSIGKRVFGLALRGGTGALFLRAFFFVPSVLFCGIGLAWSIFDENRRCWHDLVANVQPVEIARL
jgi:hypothetical protein